MRIGKWRYTEYIDGSVELYNHEKDSEEWYNLAGNEDYNDVIVEMKSLIPKNPAPLMKTSEKLSPHNTPPFTSKEEYEFWLEHDKSYPALMKKYWQVAE